MSLSALAREGEKRVFAAKGWLCKGTVDSNAFNFPAEGTNFRHLIIKKGKSLLCVCSESDGMW